MRNLTGILLLVFLTLTGAASAQEAEERSRFVTFIEEQISSPDQQIRLNGLSGTLSSSVSLDSITIADRDGVWLTIVEPQLIWERSQLLRGRLEVDRLSAQRIEVTRLPKPAPNRPDMQARQFAIPELPVAVRIGALTVDQVLLSEVVLGFAVELSVDGSFSLEEGGFNADIEILRLDGPGGVFNVATQYDPESNQVEIATRFDEPANGVLANMIGIPDRPALTFTAEGAGPVDNLAVDINLDVDGRSLSRGSVVTSQADDGTNIAADLVGQFETLVSPRLQRFFAGDTGLMAQATIFDDGALNVPSFRLSTAEALISGNLQRAGTGEVEQSVSADI